MIAPYVRTYLRARVNVVGILKDSSLTMYEEYPLDKNHGDLIKEILSKRRGRTGSVIRQITVSEQSSDVF